MRFAGFAIAALVWYGLWSFPVDAEPPSEKTFVDVREMSVKKRAELGEKLIFGAVDTWLYVHDGKEPPSPQEIESAYRKFVPAAELPMPIREPGIYPSSYRPYVP